MILLSFVYVVLYIGVRQSTKATKWTVNNSQNHYLFIWRYSMKCLCVFLYPGEIFLRVRNIVESTVAGSHTMVL